MLRVVQMAGVVGGGGDGGAGWSATPVRNASMAPYRCRAARGGAGGFEVWDVVWGLMSVRLPLLYLVPGISFFSCSYFCV